MIPSPQKSDNFSTKIRSLFSKLQKSGSKKLDPREPVTLVHGEIFDRNVLPVQVVRVTTNYGVTSSRPDGSYHMILSRSGIYDVNCENIYFNRDRYRSHSQVIFPSQDYHPLLPITLRLVWDRNINYRIPPPPLLHVQTNYAPHLTSPPSSNSDDFLIDEHIKSHDFVAFWKIINSSLVDQSEFVISSNSNSRLLRRNTRWIIFQSQKFKKHFFISLES